MQKTHRILVGTNDIAGQLNDYAAGFRALGHQVTVVARVGNPFYPELTYDVDLREIPDTLVPSRVLYQRRRIERWLRLLKLIAQHDIFVFQWAGYSLLSANHDYPLLKKLGKRIIAVCNGDDVRHWSAYDQQSRLFNGAFSPLEELDEFYRNDPLFRPLRNLRLVEQYADLVLSVPNQAALAVRPYMRFTYPLDLAKYHFNIPARDVPVVVHAPSSQPIKGTATILQALEQLRNEGVSFELKLLHGVPNYEVLAALTEADVAIDQLHLPSYGKFGAEAMALGCALATCNHEEYEPYPPDRPIWNVDPTNAYFQLRRLLTDKALRLSLAQAGRLYAEQYHDKLILARQMLEWLGDENESWHFNPTFFSRYYHLPEGEIIPAYLQRMTTKIIQRWGLPADVDPQDLIARGLMSAEGLDSLRSIPRWREVQHTLTTKG